MRLSVRRKGRRGSALVEGALVMSAFLALTVSIVDVAQFFHQQHALVEQARAAVRTGSMKNLSREEIASMVVFGQARPPAGKVEGFQGLRLENVNVEILDPGTALQRVVVHIHGLKRRWITPLLPGASDNLHLRIASPMEGQFPIPACADCPREPWPGRPQAALY